MRCNICNAILSPAEIQWNTDHNSWDPCGRCLEAVDDVFNDRTEEEIDDELELEQCLMGLYEDELQEEEYTPSTATEA